MDFDAVSEVPSLPGPNPPLYRIAEVFMFSTCTHKCGYCWYAESGEVLDFAQLEPFRDPSFIDKVTSFFVSRTAPGAKWLLQLTGGEPLIAPNLDRLLVPLIEAGNRVAFYTALLLGHNHPGFRFLLEHPHPQVDYIMASFHPEAEMDESRYFDKIRRLKDAGHKLFLRFVGQPQRLDRLQKLSDRCRDLDICFYPTTMISNNYPRAYTSEQKDLLRSHFSSLSQHIQLEGGLATKNLACYGGSRIIAVNLQTGNITPCITVNRPSLGNIFENRLELCENSIRCPEPGIDCKCDVHFQQNIVILAEDHPHFEKQRNGFSPPEDFGRQIAAMRQNGMSFYSNQRGGTGEVVDDTRSFYTLDELRRNYRKRLGLPRTELKRNDLCEIAGAVQEIRPASEQMRVQPRTPTRIVTLAGRWSYAAVVPLSIPANLDGEVWVRVRARVLQGEGGFGLFESTGTYFQDRALVGAGTEVQTIFLQVADPANAAYLIVQNSTPDGQPADILLEELAVLGPPGACHEVPDRSAGAA